MIHFNFVVSDADAENIFDALRQEILDMQIRYRDKERYTIDEREWFSDRCEYLRSLMLKMKNTYVKEQP